MKQYDVVRIIKDDPNNEFTKGQVGTILEVYEDNNYEVEISDKDGITLFLGTISGDYLPQKRWNNIENIRTIFTK
ncbi:hypothetical protein WQ54_12660 [Bacillus sp. SA1-12]|uniref:DUF4926 domain-containing protein n=1 Tax=Bacillus sp. SA1-12 TaxID=1455638 RepID=UPI00062690F8|nr:DUF4926 domain-containing protein [Bacillus sp. SA1-12]KKI91818.1 hypothetical protein WQ54_12660 [Bacillus sp. SA1-12]